MNQKTTLSRAGISKKIDSFKLPSCCVRLEINLEESKSSNGYPELDYKDFLNIEEEKANEEANSSGSEANEADVKKAVKYYEAKYQNSNYRWGDIDLGAGYDEEDSFIDNTDAYDEIVPKEITTSFGGFYVNQGRLEFKEVENIQDTMVSIDKSSSDESHDEENESDGEIDISEDESPKTLLKENLTVSSDCNNNTRVQNYSLSSLINQEEIHQSFY